MEKTFLSWGVFAGIILIKPGQGIEPNDKSNHRYGHDHYCSKYRLHDLTKTWVLIGS